MSYVQDESVLGNPGIFGFIGQAVKKVGEVISGVAKGGTVQLQPQVIVPAPTIGLPTGTPSWLLPAAVGGGALLLVLALRGRR